MAYDKLFLALLGTASAHADASRKAFTELDLTEGQPKILYLLRRNPDILQKDLAALCGIRPSTLTVLLKKLEAKKLTYKETCSVSGGKKAYKIHLTDEGHAMADQLEDVVEALEERGFLGFSQNERKVLLDMLCKIEKNMKCEPAKTPFPTQTPSQITINDLTIEYDSNKIYGQIYSPEKEGRYPAVILSHGYNGSGTDFVKECTYFAQNGYIAYAYDFCGGSVNSRSSGKSTDMTIFTEKENLLAVHDYISNLDNVDETNIFLFGGSQGGLVTSLAIEEIQDKVRAMILYFPALNIPDDWRRTYPAADNIPETTDFWGLKLGKNFFLSIHDFYTFDNIGKYPNNVLIIWGDKDDIVPRSYMETAQKTYKNAELVVLSGEGHGFSPSGIKTSMERILEFIKKKFHPKEFFHELYTI